MSLFNWNGVKFPGFTMQQLNLDWILTEIKRVMGFFPEDGNPGTVLMKTEDGTAWEELAAVDININGVPEDTELTDTDKLIFYDVSSSANRKITAPNLLNSMMSNGTPLMDGTASAGTSKKPARYDHRHPTDTSRQAALSGVQMNAVNSGAPANSFDSNGVLKIEHGGTGATTAADAIANLGIETVRDLTFTTTPGSGITIRDFKIHKVGKIVVGDLYFDVASNLSADSVIVTLSDSLPIPIDTYAVASVLSTGGSAGLLYIGRSRNIIRTWGPLSAGSDYYAEFMYVFQ